MSTVVLGGYEAEIQPCPAVRYLDSPDPSDAGCFDMTISGVDCFGDGVFVRQGNPDNAMDAGKL